MTTAATIKSRLTLDTTDFDQGISGAKKKAGSFSDKMGSIGKSMMNTGAKMTAGLTLPIVAAGGAMVKAASDLEQSIGGVQSVFLDVQDTIFDFGKTAAQEVGLSKKAFNDLAVVTGSFLQNVGFDLGEAADETIKLTERSADLAATFGGPVENAMNAVQSALKGEFNPLEQFGVKMNQADITARALAMGLGDAEGELDNNAKTLATLAIFYEQTARVQGQFEREANTLAGQMERTRAEFSNASADLGTQLLPIGLKIVAFLSDLIGKFTALNPEQQKMILIVLGIVAALGPLVTLFGALASVIGFIAGLSLTVVAPILAIIAVVGLLYLAWKNNFGGIRDFLISVWAKAKPLFEQLKQWLGVVIPIVVQKVTDFFTNVWLPGLKMAWDFISTKVIPILMGIAEVIGAIIFKAVEALVGLWQNVLFPALGKLWEWFDAKIMPTLKNVAGWLKDKLTPAFEGISRAIGDVVDWLKELANKILNMELPDWLTPGSPTPFEMGLKGINKQMSILSSLAPMKFGSGMNFAGLGGGNGAKVIDIGGVHIVIEGNATEDDVRRGTNLGIQDALRAGGRA